jgi:hypothetical protein
MVNIQPQIFIFLCHCTFDHVLSKPPIAALARNAKYFCAASFVSSIIKVVSHLLNVESASIHELVEQLSVNLKVSKVIEVLLKIFQ